MKKATLISGIIATGLIIIGALFQMQHWPGGSVIIVFGTLFYTTAFLVLNTINQIREDNDRLNIALQIVGLFTFQLIGVGLLFIVQDWPGGAAIYYGGIWAMLIAYVPLFLIGLTRNQRPFFTKNIIFILSVIAFAALSSSMRQSRNSNLSLIDLQATTLWTYQATVSTNIIILKNTSHPNKYAEQIHNASVLLQSRIDSLKLILVYQCEFKEATIPITKSDYAGSTNNYDIPTFILIGGEVNSPRQDKWSAIELKRQIDQYKELIKSTCLANEINDENIQQNIRTYGYDVGNNMFAEWQTYHFYKKTLPAVLAELSLIQNNIVNAENQVLILLDSIIKSD